MTLPRTLETDVIARLIDLLKALGVSQYAIARRAGVKQPLVSQWARGVCPVPDEHRLLLATLLLETWAQFLARDEMHPQPPIRQALDAYKIAGYRVLACAYPRGGLQALYIEADTHRATLAALLAPRAHTWTLSHRAAVRRTIDALQRTFRLLDMLLPGELLSAKAAIMLTPTQRGANG